MLPEEMKESFQKYKQSLIDKGVNIGVAREKEKAEKLKGSEVENFLKEQGISKEDIETLKQMIQLRKENGGFKYFTWQSAILVLSIADYFLEAFMANTLKLPVGIENFEEIRKLGFYYIDKTRLIEQLLQGWGKVTLFTRPRRFGKTLNMSMLKSFFEIGTD